MHYYSPLLLFADDTKLFHCIKSDLDVVQLQHDIDINALLDPWSRVSYNFSP